MEIEVSLKVRSAIKAKLLELGVHVDDELPDYIMVLVANRRSKPQMESDLELFLSENTQKFTAWLFHVLKKLEQVTLADSIAVLTGKDKVPEPVQPTKSKDKPKEDEKTAKPGKSSTDPKQSEKDKSKLPAKESAKVSEKSGSKSSDKSKPKTSGKSGSKGSEKGTSSTGVSDKGTKKLTEVKGDRKVKKVEKPPKAGTSTAPKPAEKSTESKVQFKLKNNLVKQTEFDRKQAEAEDRKAEKSGTDGQSQSKNTIPLTEAQNRDPTVQEDILNLGDDEGGDLFGDGEAAATEEAKSKGKTSSKKKAATTDDEEDVEKLRKIALETKKSPSRRLPTGNVTALRGMVMNFEKENSNKRKLQNEESDGKKSSISRSNSRSEVSKQPEPESPPKKLRSVVTVTNSSKKPSEEYDPEQPKIHKLSSVVCVTNPQRPKRNTTSMNTNLIFKAMKEVEIDNIKRPMKSHDEEESGGGGKRRHSDDRDRERGWRIARSPRRSRSRERGRDDRSSKDTRGHRRDRRDSSSGRSSHRRHGDGRSRSRSPLQLFTRRGRMSMKDRLGEKQVSQELHFDSEGLEVREDLLDSAYEDEIREMEKDVNIIINVPNVRSEISDDHASKDFKKSGSGLREKEKSPTEAPVESSNKKKSGYEAPNRISIQVMNSDSSEEESEYSDNEADRGKESNQEEEEESEAELEVTINQEQDIDDLLPPQQQNENENSQEKKVTSASDEKPVDRLTDLRAKLAAITRTNTASYSPLQLQQPSRPQAPIVVSSQPSSAYFTPYYYDSLPALPVAPNISAQLPPTTCKFWPTCSYGENCKYGHPRCKFGESCAKRPNCPFKHDGGHVYPPAFTPVPTFSKHVTKYSAAPVPPNKKLCHFFPKCHTLDCVYYHPKPCRYGVSCSDPSCTHYHPGVTGSIGERKGGKLPALHQLKWSKAKTDGGPSEQHATTT